MQKVYRNGKKDRDPLSKILSINLGVIFLGIGFGFSADKYLDRIWEYNDTTVITIIYAVCILVGIIVYLYLSLTRILPLAQVDEDTLKIRTNILFTKKVNLSKASKITCQYCSEHDQRMRVKYPGEAPIEFIIKQTNCSTEDLISLITTNHDIEVSYS